jgi:colanic acid/amylovoran biosynthesis glycosyltransferase
MHTVEPRRVGLLIPEFPSQTHVAWWRVGKAMRSLGVEVVMISTRRPRGIRNPHPELEEEARRTFYAWPPRLGACLATMVQNPRGVLRAIHYVLRMSESTTLEKLRTPPLVFAAAGLARFARTKRLQLIHVHSCANAAHLAALSRLLGGVPYSLRLGGDLEVYGKDHASKMKDAVLVVPGAAAYVPRIVHELGIPEERVFWTWVGVETDVFTPGKPPPRADGGEIHAVTIARLNNTKGHLQALGAVRRLKDQGIVAHYTIAGEGPMEAEIRRKVVESGLETQVELVGALSQEQVIDLLRRAHVFIMPSFGLGESTPAAVSEAMSCGVPVISTIIGGTPEMIRDGVDGFLVDQNDEGAIAAPLLRLAQDEQLRREMARAAREGAIKFDCREVARNILERAGLPMLSPVSGDEPQRA